MRYDKGRKESSRKRILASASARFRRDGIAAVGLRSLVGDVGLTHGAFYAHFPSRSDLVAESVGSALADTHGYFTRKMAKAEGGGRLEGFVDEYLAMRHRAEPHRGCAGAALAPEVAREGPEARRSFMRGVDQLTDMIAGALSPGGSDRERRARARTIFAGMMGALQLARVAEDDDAEQILSDARSAALSAAARPWTTSD